MEAYRTDYIGVSYENRAQNRAQVRALWMLFVARGQLSRTEWFVFPTDCHGLTRIFDYAFGFVLL